MTTATRIKLESQLDVNVLMSNAHALADGSYPTLDFLILRANQLLQRIAQGGVVALQEQGRFAGGESAFLAIQYGYVSASYFERSYKFGETVNG